jgi:hypothetical protein
MALLVHAMQAEDAITRFPAGSWECGRYKDQRSGETYAACREIIPNVAEIILDRQSDGLDVVAKPSCSARAFSNVYSVHFGPLRGHPNRSAEVKALIGGNFKDALKECTSRPPKLEIDEGDVAALLDATDWVEFPPNVAAETKK